jgi:hypothetical protein
MYTHFTFITSPLDQFEVRNLLSFDAPILGNIRGRGGVCRYKSLTTRGLYTQATNNGNTSGRGLEPNWVTGFADGEASFHVSIYKCDSYKTKWRVIPSFQIELHEKDLGLLNQIQSFFGVGTIRINKKRNSANYCVQSIKDLTSVIIPHFVQYPLITQKQADFLLFKSVVELMNSKEHLTSEGFNKIVVIKASMNLGLPKQLMESFPGITAVSRPVVEVAENINPF